jgi:hypothetical protein
MTEMPELAAPEEESDRRASLRKQRWMLAGIIAGIVVFLAAVALAVYFLLQPGSPTGTIRDIFIIFLALESLIIGVALVVLIIQLASLINLLQNEVKPIIQSTSETINTLRGTTAFLSENLVEPVIKLNSTMAGIRKLFSLFGIKRK